MRDNKTIWRNFYSRASEAGIRFCKGVKFDQRVSYQRTGNFIFFNVDRKNSAWAEYCHSVFFIVTTLFFFSMCVLIGSRYSDAKTSQDNSIKRQIIFGQVFSDQIRQASSFSFALRVGIPLAHACSPYYVRSDEYNKIINILKEQQVWNTENPKKKGEVPMQNLSSNGSVFDREFYKFDNEKMPFTNNPRFNPDFAAQEIEGRKILQTVELPEVRWKEILSIIKTSNYICWPFEGS